MPRRPWLYDFARRAFAEIARVARVRLLPSGLETLPEGQVILAITHFGYLDFVPVALVWWEHRGERLRFLVGPRPYRNKLLGAAITACGGLPVLGGPHHESLNASLSVLEDGWSIGVFPEAGVSRSFTVRHCHSGAARMAVQTGVPLIPVGVWGGHLVTTRGHGTFTKRGQGSIRDLWNAPLRVHFGPPLRLTNADDPEEASGLLQSAMQAAADVAVLDFPLGRPPGAWWLPAKFGGGAPTEAERDIWDARDVMNGLRPDRDKM